MTPRSQPKEFMLPKTVRWTVPREGETRRFQGHDVIVGAVSSESAIVHYGNGSSNVAALTDLRPLGERAALPDLTPPWEPSPIPATNELAPPRPAPPVTPSSLDPIAPASGTATQSSEQAPASPAAHTPRAVTTCPVPGCVYQAKNLGPHMKVNHQTTVKEVRRAARRGVKQAPVPAPVPDSAPNQVVAGLRLSVEVNLSLSELSTWPPDRLAALFRGVALVIEAKAGTSSVH